MNTTLNHHPKEHRQTILFIISFDACPSPASIYRDLSVIVFVSDVGRGPPAYFLTR